MDTIEVIQDVPSDMNCLSLSYSSYKSRHTVKALTDVVPNSALVFKSELLLGSTSGAAIVDHCGVLIQKHFQPGYLI